MGLHLEPSSSSVLHEKSSERNQSENC
jgi:hypothetical protein